MNFLKNIFKRKNIKPTASQIKQKNIQQSEYVDTINNRMLRLGNEDCAMIFHPHGKVQIVFTKFYNNETQQITPEEETLMAIAIFLKQPGFSELLRTEFNNIAIKNFKMLADDKGDN